MSSTVRRRGTFALAVGLLGSLLVGGTVPAAHAAPEPPVSFTPADFDWQYLDDNTDPAAGAASRTAWAAPSFDDQAWKTGKAPFGAKKGGFSGSGASDVGGANFPVTTALNQFIDGNDYPNVPVFFFRTSLELSADQLDGAAALTGSAQYDDSLTLYVNGDRVAGYDDGDITENLQYGGSNSSSPKTAEFTVPSDKLVSGENVIGVEVHNGRATSSDLYFALQQLQLEYGDTGVTISDLNLNIGADETQRNLVWYTNTSASQVAQLAKQSDVVGGEFPATAQSFAATSAPTVDNQFSHRTTLDGLEANTEYVYRVGDETNGWSEHYTFETGAFDGDYSFLFVGDPQIGASGNVANDRDGWVATLDTAEQQFPDSSFIFSAGDQVEHAANESQYDAFLAPEQLRSIPLVTVNGNHDVGSKAYEQHFHQPNWDPSYGAASSSSSSGGNHWFRYNDVLYVVLNSNSRDYASHEAFMEKVVEEQGDDVKWKVLAFHHSIYSVASHTNDSDILDRRAKMPETISELGFDMVLMGHDHSYTRSWLMNDGEVAETGGVAQPKVTAKAGDVLYVTANSASGSKYYSVKAPSAPFAAVINQENKRNYSNVEVTDRSLTVTTYRSENNTVVDQVELQREDRVKPELTVPADSELSFGDDFDPLAGVSAHDAIDGDLTSEIVVEGEVDTRSLGAQQLVYTVQDEAGNTATATRTVTVVEAALTAATPRVSGAARVGGTLAAKPGSWTSGAKLSYQWNANGKAIKGATSPKLKLDAKQAGKRITVSVKGSLAGYSTTTKTSSSVKIGKGVFVKKTPKIAGTAKVGAKLRVSTGSWKPAAKLSIRWYANGKAIKGATGKTLKLGKKQAGKRITVQVMGSKSGYTTAKAKSKATAKVKAAKKARR